MSVETAKSDILSWLDREDWPGDIYELLGRKRFDPNIAEMCDEVTAGAREVLPYQAHANPQKAMRAMRLLTEFVGRAADVLSNAEKVGEENERIYDEIRESCKAEHGENPSFWQRDALLMWVAEDANVHSDAVDEIIKVLQAKDQESAKKKSKTIHPKIADDVEKPVMPIILDTPEAAAPVILDSDPEPDANVAALDGSAAAHPSGAAAPVILPAAEPARAKPKAKPPALSPRSSGTVAAAPKSRAAKKPQPPRAPAAVVAPTEEEPKSKRVYALVAFMVGLPLVFLAGVLIWKFGLSKSDDQPDDKKSETARKQDSDDDRRNNQDPDNNTNVVNNGGVKTQSERFADLLAEAKRTAGKAPRREAFKKALAVATTTSQKAQVYAELATDYDYVNSLSPAEARTAIDVLSRDSILYRKVGGYAGRLKESSDVQALLNDLHARLSRGQDRAACERVIPIVLGHHVSGRALTMQETINEWIRAHKAVTSLTAKQSLERSLPNQLKAREKTFEGIKLLTAKLETSPTDDTATALLKKTVEDVFGSRQIPRVSDQKATFAAAAVIGRNTSSSLTRRVLARNLLKWADGINVLPEAAKHFQELVKKDAGDKFASEVLNEAVDDLLKVAKKKTGLPRVTAYDEIWKLTAEGASRAKLAEAMADDEEYMQSAGFDKGLKLHEAIIAHFADPAQKTSDYTLSTKVKALIRFAEEHKKLDAISKRYVTELQIASDKTVPQAVVNQIAKTRVTAVRPKLGSKWSKQDYTAVEEALKHADTETQAAQYDSLMTDVGFIGNLEFYDYLKIEEQIIAGSTSETRTEAALARMTKYLNYLRSPSKNPRTNRRAIIGRWKNAETHLKKRLKEDKNNQAAARMLKAVDKALAPVRGSKS